MHNLSSNVIFGLLAVGVGLAGAITDVRSRLIPNWLTGPAMLAGLLLHGMSGGWAECGRALLALLLCGAVFLVFYVAGGMGAGDVKLIAAQAAFFSLPGAVPLLVLTALCGGAMGLVVAARYGKVRETVANVLVLTAHHSRNGLQPHPELNVSREQTLRLPYGVAIAAGSLLTALLPMLSGASV